MSESPVAISDVFFERAVREAERYGDDPWIFLRELVQNSRDAGATSIRFTTWVDNHQEAIMADDNGGGMSRADVDKYLLRLYASGKAARAEAAAKAGVPSEAVGQFGVGFWSVLRFMPSRIRVESQNGHEAVGFEVDCEKRIVYPVEVRRTAQGTTVSLVRPRSEPDAQTPQAARSLSLKVRDRVLHYAGRVRGVGENPAPVLTVDGEVVNSNVAPKGWQWEPLHGKGFDGQIGLGDRPSVRLYAHGLLIKEAGSLEELLPRHQSNNEDHAGLFPVAEVNADGLEVLLDRQGVVEGRLLQSIVKTSDKQLKSLRRRVTDALAPLSPLLLLRFFLKRKGAPFGIALVGMLVAWTAAVAMIPSSAPASSGRVPLALVPGSETIIERFRVEGAVDRTRGPSVDSVDADSLRGSTWALSYDGPDPVFLRIATFVRYDEEEGLLPPTSIAEETYPFAPKASAGARYSVSVELQPGTAPFVLPVPTGHRVVEGTVHLGEAPVPVLVTNEEREPVLARPTGEGGILAYQTVASTSVTPPSPAAWTGATSVPDAMKALVERGLLLSSPTERADLALRFIEHRLRYSTSVDDARKFKKSSGAWIDRVLELGVGDCDVMNGMNVLLLRSLKVPARLAVGFVGREGRVAPQLHAWTEYWDGGWKTVDASPPVALPAELLAPLASVPEDLDLVAAVSRGEHPYGDDDGVDEGDEGDEGDDAPGTEPAAATGTPVPGEVATSPSTAAAAAAVPSTAARTNPAEPLGEAREAVPLPQPSLWTRLSRRLPSLLAGIALTVLIGSVGFESWRRRRVRLSAAEEDELALALLRHVVQHPAQGDPLMVRERPFFRTTKGRRLSLARIEKLARAGRLFAAYPGAALLEYIQSSTPILDRSDSRVEHFREHLPDLVLLDPLAHLLDDSPRPPVLAEVERILNRVDNRVIVHASPGDDEIREVYLPTIAGRLPRLHITVGLGDPEVQRALNLYARASGQARFILLKRVLERTTIFLPEADVLLGKLAQEVLP